MEYMKGFLQWIEGPVILGLVVFIILICFRIIAMTIKLDKELKKLQEELIKLIKGK